MNKDKLKEELLNYLVKNKNWIKEGKENKANSALTTSYWEGKENLIKDFIEKFVTYKDLNDIIFHLNLICDDLEKKEKIQFEELKQYFKGGFNLIDEVRWKINQLKDEDNEEYAIWD